MKRLFFAMLAFSLTVLWMRLTTEHGPSSIAAIYTGHSAPPFSRRLLAPLAAVGLDRITGLGLGRSTFLLAFLALYASLATWFRMLRRWYSERDAMLGTLALAAALLPCLIGPPGFKTAIAENLSPRCLSDILHILFAVGLVATATAGNWGVWLALMALGSLNREVVIVYALPAFIAAWGSLARRRRQGLLDGSLVKDCLTPALGVAIWATCKYSLHVAFPGPAHWDTWQTNLAFLAGLDLWQALGLAWIAGGLWIYLFARPREVLRLPQSLLIHATIAIPIVIAYLFAAQIWEVRIWTDLAIVFSPLLFVGFKAKKA